MFVGAVEGCCCWVNCFFESVVSAGLETATSSRPLVCPFFFEPFFLGGFFEPEFACSVDDVDVAASASAISQLF